MPIANSHVDRLLTDFSIGYMQSASVFGGDRAATLKRVQRKSDKYRVWDIAQIMRDDMRVTAPHEPAPVVVAKMSTDTYTADVRRLKSFYSDEERNDDDNPAGTEQGLVGQLSQKAIISRERNFVSTLFGTGLWTTNTEQTGVAAAPGANQFLQWNDASATPIDDINTQKLIVRNSCGFMPNTIVLSEDVALTLANHASIVGRFQYTKGGAVSYEDLRDVLQVERLTVLGGAYNSAIEGATASIGAIAGKHALLAYVDHSDGGNMMTPTAMTCFSWTQHDRKTAEGASIRRWRSEDPAGDYLEASIAFDYKKTSDASAVFFASAIA